MTHREVIHVFKYLNGYNDGEETDLFRAALQGGIKQNSGSFDRAGFD